MLIMIPPDTRRVMKTHPLSFEDPYFNQFYFRKLPPRIAQEFMTWDWDTRWASTEFALGLIPEGISSSDQLTSAFARLPDYEPAHHGELLLYHSSSPEVSSRYRGIVSLRDRVGAAPELSFFCVNGQPCVVSAKVLIASVNESSEDEQPFAVLLKSRR